jgi:hypothetical protein
MVDDVVGKQGKFTMSVAQLFLLANAASYWSAYPQHRICQSRDVEYDSLPR